MLIIPSKPLTWKEHISLAANTELWEGYVILPTEKGFQLSLHKRFLLPTTPPHDRYYPIALLETHDQCEQLFQSIVDAMENGDRVFRVKNWLEKNALKIADLPTV